MITRFDRMTRLVHWSTAVLTGLLLVTGTILYVAQFSAIVGRRALLVRIHVVSGVLLFVPLVVGLVVSRALRDDVRVLNRWTRSDRAWLRKRTREAPAGKFNGGQKLATALFGGLLAVQLLTGALMHWNEPFSDAWRTGATFVHDWGYLALVALTVGHILRARREPELLTSMRTGVVPREWAERERPGWAQAVEAP